MPNTNPPPEFNLNTISSFLDGWLKKNQNKLPKNARGFDRRDYDKARLEQLLRTTQLQFVAYYFTTTNRPYVKNRFAWMGKREEILKMGEDMKPPKTWGIVPTYLGAQEKDLAEYKERCFGPEAKLKHTDLTKGKDDAIDAINKAIGEGFDYGTYIYLDIESNVPKGVSCDAAYAVPNTADMINYWKEWCYAITDLANYPAGVTTTFGVGLYCWGGSAQSLMDAVMKDPNLSNRMSPRLWVICYPPVDMNKFNFSKTLDPMDNLFSVDPDHNLPKSQVLTYNVDIWQMPIEIEIENPPGSGLKEKIVKIDFEYYKDFTIDRDISRLADPGAPDKTN